LIHKIKNRMPVKIGASLACANQIDLSKDLKELIKNKIDFIHIDIMDGVFVKNYCFGLQIFDYLKYFSNTEFDVHLMVDDPFNKVDLFNGKAVNAISFHLEAASNPIQTIKKIKSMGFKPGIAINAGSSENLLDYLYEHVDYILVMAVEAGFTGQKFLRSSIKKVERIKDALDKRGYSLDIFVDGHIDKETIRKLYMAGANVFIGGSSGLFTQDNSIENNLKILRKAITWR